MGYLSIISNILWTETIHKKNYAHGQTIQTPAFISRHSIAIRIYQRKISEGDQEGVNLHKYSVDR